MASTRFISVIIVAGFELTKNNSIPLHEEHDKPEVYQNNQVATLLSPTIDPL